MSDFLIYHNPRCSKSRETLAILKDEGMEPVVVEYLKEPPTKATLRALAKKLKMRPKEFLRIKEPVFKELTLDLEDDDAVLEAMAKHPVLMERPIVTRGQKAILGRPPENVRNLFSR